MIFRKLKGGERFFLKSRKSLGLLIKVNEPLRAANGVIVKAITDNKGVAVIKIKDEMEVKKQDQVF